MEDIIFLIGISVLFITLIPFLNWAGSQISKAKL